jgi:hypothetical protein
MQARADDTPWDRLAFRPPIRDAFPVTEAQIDSKAGFESQWAYRALQQEARSDCRQEIHPVSLTSTRRVICAIAAGVKWQCF